MAAVVSREHARATWLTGLAGLLILAVAFAMMACAAPSLVPARTHGAVTQAATVYTSSLPLVPVTTATRGLGAGALLWWHGQ